MSVSPSDTTDITKSAQTSVLSTTHSPLGTHGLWGDKSAQLPAYIQNIAKALIRSGHGESSAIAMAVGAVKRWASGRGKVTPEVRAAAGKALAEWEKLKAEHSKSKSSNDQLMLKSIDRSVKLTDKRAEILGLYTDDKNKTMMSKKMKNNPVADTDIDTDVDPDNKSRFTWQPGDIQFADDDSKVDANDTDETDDK